VPAFRTLKSNIKARVGNLWVVGGDKPTGAISRSGSTNVTNGPEWIITAWSEADYNKALIVLVPLSAGLLLLVVALVLYFYIKGLGQKRELKHLTQLAIVHNTFAVMMHEIRNLLNIPVFVLNNETIEPEDRQFALDSIYTVRDATTKFLTYEKLLRSDNAHVGEGTNVAQHNLQSHVYDILYHMASGIKSGLHIQYMWTDDCSNIILYDDKMQEIIMNLLTNAIKHTSDSKVTVKIRLAGGFIILEIINRYTGPPIDDIQRLYIPYFMREEPSLWLDVVNNKLTRDDKISTIVTTLISNEPVWHTHNIYSRGPVTATAKHIKSTGMGLSIVRLLCKAMKGETDIIVDGDMVHQWAAITYSAAISWEEAV